MKKSLKRITVFILVLSMVISMGASPYANEILLDESHQDSIEVTPEEPGGTQGGSEETTEDSEETPGDSEETTEGSEETPEGSEGNSEGSEENPGGSEENPEDSEETPEDPEENPEGSEETPEGSEENPVVPGETPVLPEVPVVPVVPVVPEGETATLIINHLLGNGELLQTEVIEGLVIGEVISGTDFIMEFEGIKFVESSPSELELVEGDNELNLYYDSTVGPTIKLTINHYNKLDGELGDEPQLLETETIETLEIGRIVSAMDFAKEFENMKFVEGDPSELLLEEGENELNLYYSKVGPTTKLTINHYKKLESESGNEFEHLEAEMIELLEIETVESLEKETMELLETEIIDGLEIGRTVYPVEFTKGFEGLMFLESDPSELLLQEEGNELNLYYMPMKEGIAYMAEAPDFPPGEGMEIESPYIEEFEPGELGPFEEEEEFSRSSLFNLMNSGSHSDEVNNKDWPKPGSLLLEKSGTEVEGTGNQWEIELKIKGKNKTGSSDIVLVIDRSGSMGDGGRMANAKTAAKSFVNTMFDGPNAANTRIALVSFAGDVLVNQGFTVAANKNTLISKIDGLNASGGTHIQAGIRQGITTLGGSTADNKNIVFLGDGAATYSYQPKKPDDYLDLWYTTGTGTWFNPFVHYYRTNKLIPQDGFNYNTTVGNGQQEHTVYSGRNNYRHGAHAVAEAGFAPAGQTIYTIALGAGPEGDWTLENMATSPSKYYNTPNPANLTAIYAEIAGSIASAATDAVVTDPLGGMYDILGINATNYNSLITVSHGTLGWNSATETITWTIGTITEGTDYWMKYKVALDYSAEGGVYYPANKPTDISYTNIDGKKAKKYFPIPEFRLRELTLTKILSNGKLGDSNKKFDIILEGPTGPYKKTWSVSLKPGESKKIKGLLPGTYTVKEVVPMNFKLVSGTGTLVIGVNDWKVSKTVTNKRSNGGWFWDDPDPKINSFTVGTGSNHASLPTDNKSLYVKLDYFVIPVALEKEYQLNQA